ncbi:MAG: universal stress protein [Brevirhabdus sp.]
MSYKTILTVLSAVDRLDAQLESAISLARQEEAHLEVLCLGIDVAISGYYYAGAAAVVSQATSASALEDAQKLEKLTRERLARSEIAWSVEAIVALDTSLHHIVSRRARFSDLVVLPRPYGARAVSNDEVILEASLFDGFAPVLMLPETTLDETPGKRIVMAWNESDEAFAAVRKALPALKRAQSVSIAVVDPRIHDAKAPAPGEELARLLDRHGVEVEISILARDLPRVSEVLGRHARDIGADLVVMGAYGHSRFRESILGGATRDMLETSELPVLLAH